MCMGVREFEALFQIGSYKVPGKAISTMRPEVYFHKGKKLGLPGPSAPSHFWTKERAGYHSSDIGNLARCSLFHRPQILLLFFEELVTLPSTLSPVALCNFWSPAAIGIVVLPGNHLAGLLSPSFSSDGLCEWGRENGTDPWVFGSSLNDEVG